jgi:hypothetical protein
VLEVCSGTSRTKGFGSGERRHLSKQLSLQGTPSDMIHDFLTILLDNMNRLFPVTQVFLGLSYLMLSESSGPVSPDTKG